MTVSDWQKIIDSARKAHHGTVDSFPSSSRKRKFKDDLSIDGNVRILDQSFFEKNFNMHNSILQALIDNIVDGSTSKQPLNNEQERAFHIIANHLSLPHQKQLLMYLGGMGGTGKTKVINSVLAFFAEREESYRFKVLAPTGSAAALIGGNTYQSVIGINDRQKFDKISEQMLGKVRDQLSGVQYIFMDEVSMLSCHDLAKISKRLAIVTGKHELPFGGINMIFAVDFAQLPPVIGSSSSGSTVALYSQPPEHGTDERSINHALGKALWHQVTTVVILRQNMRQRSQSEMDRKLRSALEHLRYKNCDKFDLQFLESR